VTARIAHAESPESRGRADLRLFELTSPCDAFFRQAAAEGNLTPSRALETSHENHVPTAGATPRWGTFMEMRGKNPAPYLQEEVGTADEEGPAT